MQVLKTIREVFKSRLESFRGEMTQEEFSELLGIPKNQYWRLESKGMIPREKVLNQIATRLKIPETLLFLDPDLAGKHAKNPFSDPIFERLAGIDRAKLEDALAMIEGKQSKSKKREVSR